MQKQIDSLLDRIVEATSPSVIAAYEKRIESLEQNKLLLAEKASQTHKPQRCFSEMFERAMQFLSNPYKIWENGDLPHKIMVLRMAFSKRLAYHRNEGFRTVKTTLPFKVLGGLQEGEFRMARPGGFEPPTS